MAGKKTAVQQREEIKPETQPSSSGSDISERVEKKDPAIAALIALVCGLFLGAAGAGYIFLGKVKKGLIYVVASWLLFALVIIGYVILSVVTMGVGSLICLPVFVLPFILNLAIVWDVYLEAKGEKLILPDFK